ncbi:MAG: flagellar FlbD family protein [Sphingomonas sp.]|nr:flagellar FlbD family protein [Sphingomonas sp.]
MFVKFTSPDRVPVAVNAAQISFISSVSEGTRIRFGEGRSVTVVEPMDEIIDRLNRTNQLPDG